MKKYLSALLFFIIFSSANAHAKVAIQILRNEQSCLEKKMSMNTTILISDEIFKFDPSCAFSFDESFKTKDGLECKIHAGMCSSFSPKNRFEVDCEDKSHAGADIVCP